MTELAHAHRLAPSHPQLPVAAYFDPEVLAREKALLFEQGPGYVGHELMVPN
ncbi:MAG: choline monooxygenase, partial [Pseudomonadota bacterium]|nr:choline monooxygenase [Pseudomonadota bacterium]